MEEAAHSSCDIKSSRNGNAQSSFDAFQIVISIGDLRPDALRVDEINVKLILIKL